MMAFECQVVNQASDYRVRTSQVAELFFAVFRRPFPAEVWEQWYLDNPYGDPCVALTYHADQLVGHHALVPQTLVGSSGDQIRYRLSISLMVHPRFRNLTVFQEMVDSLHRRALEDRVPFILGFPNARAAPLWEALYRYRPMIQTELCNWMPRNSPAAKSKRVEGPRDCPGLALYSCPRDKAYWNWRNQNNHARACTVDGDLEVVYKVIEPATLMVLDVGAEAGRKDASSLAGFADSLGLSNVRLTRHHAGLFGIPDAELTPHDNYVVRCFGFPLAGELPRLRLSLLLSDVF